MAEAIGRTFSHLWWLVSVLIMGVLLTFLAGPFLLFYLDLNFRSSILMDRFGSFRIFTMGWEHLYEKFPIYTLLMVSFFVGFSVNQILFSGVPHLFQRYRKALRPVSEKAPDQTGAEAVDARFRIWLNKHPAEKAHWDWEFFKESIADGLALSLFASSLLYAIFLRSLSFDLSGLLIFSVLCFMTFLSYESSTFHHEVFSSVQRVLYEQFKREKEVQMKNDRAP
jgi:hypothetical protein